MSLAKITTIGFEEYLQSENDSLFTDAVFPSSLDRDTIVNTILLRTDEFEVVYANPYFMKDAITSWAKSFYRTFEKWANAYFEDYKPLENYNRTETWKDKQNTVNNTYAKSDISGSTQNDISAYDASTFTPKDKETSSSSNTANGNSLMNNEQEHEGNVYGNIGVTTSQAMLEAEYEVSRFNIYEQIADLFIQKFCICVY